MNPGNLGEPEAPLPPRPTSHTPCDWSWVLVGGCLLEAVGVLVVASKDPVTAEQVAATDALVMLLGMNSMVLGYLLFRHSSRVHSLMRWMANAPWVAVSARGLGAFFVCEGGGVVAAGVTSIITPLPSPIPFLCLIFGPAILAAVWRGLHLFRRVRGATWT